MDVIMGKVENGEVIVEDLFATGYFPPGISHLSFISC